MLARRTLLKAALAGAVGAPLGAPSAALAQGLPPGPVRLIVGFPAGGSTDAMARIIADALGPRAGRPIIVENNSGASGRLAADTVRRARPDGGTILVGHIGLVALAPITFSDVTWSPVRDFSPVIRAADFQLALVTGPMTGAGDLASVIGWFRANPDRANIGVPQTGSLSHLNALRFIEAAGLKAVCVSYKGSAPMASDLAGGHIAAGFAAVGDFAEQHRSGTLRLLGASGVRRPPLEGVPTFAESGLKGLEGNGWNGLLLPGGAPPDLTDALNREVQALLGTPAVADKLGILGFVVPPANSPADFSATILADMENWRPIVKAAGLDNA